MRSIIILLIIGIIPFLAAAQGTGTITGTCTLPDSIDRSGITIVLAGMNRTTTTASNGSFSFTTLAAGSYTVQAGKLRYGNASLQVSLAAGETETVTLALTTAITDTFAGMATGQFTTASTNVGNVGVPNRFIEAGDSGFVWSGMQYLKEASLMIGSATNRVSDAARFIFGISQDNLDQDFYSLSDIVTTTSGADSTIHVTLFDDRRSNAPPGTPSTPLGLEITQTTSGFGATGRSGYMMVTLDLRNMSDDTLSSLLAGWFIDWNIGGGAQDRGGIIRLEQQVAGLNRGLPFPAEIAYQKPSGGAPGPFLGIVPLSQAEFRSARIAPVQTEIAIGAPSGGLTESNKFVYMRDRRSVNTSTDRGIAEDLAMIVSLGGFESGNHLTSVLTLPARGGTARLGFAFVGGSDSLEFVANAREAQRHWIERGNGMSAYTGPWQVEKGWQMISLPLSVPDGAKSVLFPRSSSDAYSLDRDSGYVSAETMEPGIGYWLKFPAAESVFFSGSLRMADTLDVDTGWNMIGTLSYPVPVSSVVTDPPGILNGKFFWYDVPGYSLVDTLMPARAYWVKANQPGKVILTVPQ